MPIYAWKCPICGSRNDSTSREGPVTCSSCASPMVRDYSSVQFGSTGLEPHFNHAVGSYVNSNRDFDEKLKAAGEAAGTTYARLDPGEQPRPTQDDQAFDTQAKTFRDRNLSLDSMGNVRKGS